MTSVMEIIRKVGLFLFGIVLIVWGYKANAATNKEEAISVKGGISPLLKALEEKLKQQKEVGQDQKKEEPEKTNRVNLPIEKKKEENKETKETKETKVEPQTVIEKETPEESSGTE